jgi:hypothetical protein
VFFFWLGVMSVGNFLSYVPVRTFASHADMSTVVRGLNVSPWVIALGLGIPFGVAIGHFLRKMLPEAKAFLFGTEPILQGVLVLMTTYFIFVFFGGAGLHNYGNTGYWISACCEYLFFPTATSSVCRPNNSIVPNLYSLKRPFQGPTVFCSLVYETEERANHYDR